MDYIKGGWVSVDQPSPWLLITYQIGLSLWGWSTSCLKCWLEIRSSTGDRLLPLQNPTLWWLCCCGISVDIALQQHSGGQLCPAVGQEWRLENQGDGRLMADYWYYYVAKTHNRCVRGRFGLRSWTLEAFVQYKKTWGKGMLEIKKEKKGAWVQWWTYRLKSNKSFTMSKYPMTCLLFIHERDLPEWRTESWITLQRNHRWSF